MSRNVNRRLCVAAIVACIGCGDQSGKADLGPDAGAGGGGPPDAAVATIDMAVTVVDDLAAPTGPADMADPTVLQSLKLATTGPIAVARDDDGQPIVAGSLTTTSSFGGLTLAPTPVANSPIAGDAYVAALDRQAVHRWGNHFGDGLHSAVAQTIAFNIVNGTQKVVCIAGSFSGELKLSDQIDLKAASDPDPFVAGLDGVTGAPLWAVAFDGTADAALNIGASGGILGIAANRKSGGFVVAGFANGASGNQALFVVELDGATGTKKWAPAIVDTALSAAAYGVAVDGDGAAYVVGQYAGQLDFGNGLAKLTDSRGASYYNMFVAKLLGGVPTAAVDVHGRGQNLAQAVALDGAGNLAIAGHIQGRTVTVGPGIVLAPAGTSKDGFVAKLTTGLQPLWARRIGEPEDAVPDGGTTSVNAKDQEAWTVAFNRSGGVIVGGYFDGTVDFGTGSPITSLSEDAFLLGLDGAGAAKWQRWTHGGSLSTAEALGVVVDPNDDSVWVAGTFISHVADTHLPNWGTSLASELIFPLDEAHTHTYLVHLVR